MTQVTNPRDFIWVEKYRPSKLLDVILPSSIMDIGEGILKAGRVPNLLLSGPAGCGKTTFAYAICKDLDADVMFINASAESGIDTIRTKMTQFASTASFSDARKVTILDEADGLSAAAQGALRSFSEEFSENHSVIMTCNLKHKIIDPLQSRSVVIDFSISKEESPKLMAKMHRRLSEILTIEGVEFDKAVLAEIIKSYFPDFRRVLNEVQKYSIGGKIDAGLLNSLSEESIKELWSIIKAKKFNDARRWVAEHEDMECSTVFRRLYTTASESIEPRSIPELVLILAQYQYWDAFVPDKQINMIAAITEIMTKVSK